MNLHGEKAAKAANSRMVKTLDDMSGLRFLTLACKFGANPIGSIIQ
jgi:hypothetical protein